MLDIFRRHWNGGEKTSRDKGDTAGTVRVACMVCAPMLDDKRCQFFVFFEIMGCSLAWDLSMIRCWPSWCYLSLGWMGSPTILLLFSSFLLYWNKTVASTQTLNLQLVFLRRLSSLSSHHTNGFSSYVSSHHLNCTRLSTTIDLCLAWSLWLSRLSSTSASPTPTPRSSVLRAPPPNGETFFGEPEGRYSDGRPIDHWLHRNGI